MSGRWADISRAAIARVHAALPPGATPMDRRRALRDAYPFAQRSGWAYKAWLRERNRYLQRYPDPMALKDSPLFRAARGLCAEKPKRKAVLRLRESGVNAQGRYALFACPRCKFERVIAIACDADKLTKHPCPTCNEGAR